MPDTSDNEDPLGPFDAFRARRAEEQAANEPFPEEYTAPEYAAQEHAAQEYTPQEYTAGAYAAEQYVPEQHVSDQYATEQFVADPYVTGQYAQPVPQAPAASGGNRGRLRSVAVLAGAVVLVAGAVGGVYAATRSSGSPVAASGPAASGPTASASPSAGAGKGAKNGKAAKAVTARLTVTSVSGDSFTATAANGRTVSVQITATTKFGTAARPFTRSQLVTGAVVFARLRHEADGTVVATVIASAGTSASASASADTSADTGA